MELPSIDSIFAPLVAARWIHFASVFVLYGSSLYWIYMGRAAASDRACRATARLLAWAAPIAALSGLAWLAGTIANMAGSFGDASDPATLRLFFFETQFGPVSAFRLALLVAAIVLVMPPLPRSIRAVMLPLVSALLLISQAWLGHAAEGGSGLHGATMIATYGVHMLAAGAWVGGLPPLLFTLLAQSRDHDGAAARTLAVLSRYSAMATVAVVAIVVSGVMSAGFRVGDTFVRLLATDYGNVLFTKVSLVAAMLGLAFVNRFLIMPCLAHGAPRAAKATVWVRRSVALEIVFGIIVLGVAAVLGITPPPQ